MRAAVTTTWAPRLFGVLIGFSGIACHETTAGQPVVRERWYQQQSGYGYPRPAIAGAAVMFGTGDGRIVARDVATGAARWSAKVADSWIGGSNMVVRSGVVIVPVVSETVALDVATGSVRWKYSAPNDTVGAGSQSAPGSVYRTHIDADSQTVFIPAWGASISAVDVTTGVARWVWQPGRAPSDTAATGLFRSGSDGLRVSGDTVFATAWHFLDAAGQRAEAWLVALDRRTGSELWRVTMPSYTGGVFVNGAPAISGSLVIFESTGGHEYAIDRNSQRLVWEFKPNTKLGTEAQTELYGGVAYHDGGDSFIYALRATDGALVWRAPFSSQTGRDLLVTERRVIFTDGGSLYILDRQNGRQIARLAQPHTADSFFASPAAYANGQVFVTVGEGAWSFDEP